jgi:hypothetical protein
MKGKFSFSIKATWFLRLVEVSFSKIKTKAHFDMKDKFSFSIELGGFYQQPSLMDCSTSVQI